MPLHFAARLRCLVRLGPAVLFPLVAQGALDTAYAVQASATVQSAPAQITLSWTQAPVPVISYALSRKPAGAGAWTPLITLNGTETSFTDPNVTPGMPYEYQIVRQAPALNGYGYLASGIDLPVVDARGRVILIVDNSIAGALAAEIEQLIRDLMGDGWTVTRREVGRGDPPASVREVIRAAVAEDRVNSRALFLLGHVPVAFSGNLDVDGHGGRPLPADTYYGDVDGNWTDANNDGVFDQNQIPSDVDLMVGRVDFADLPGSQAAAPFPGETELLRRYLTKDHEYRHGLRRMTARALVGDRIGDAAGEAFAGSGFRNFSALLGTNRVTAANVEDNSPVGERWISQLTTQDWQWVFGASSGDTARIGWLGTHGAFNEVWSADLLDQRARGTFYLLFGSRFMDWSQPDNILRAALAVPDYGLAAAWAGRPHLFFQHMAMGETIGYGIRLSQNNTTLYTNQVNLYTRGVHVALLGDPTLRLQVVAPPGGLQVAPGGGAPALSWSASPEADAGYHIYRAASASGPFVRVTNPPVMATSFTDQLAPVGDFTYMVRAVRREVSGSGSYFNQSQGIFAQASVTTPGNVAPAPTPVVPSSAPAPAPTAGGVQAPTPVSGGGNPAPTTPGGTAGGGGGAPSPWMIAALALLVFARCGRRP